LTVPSLHSPRAHGRPAGRPRPRAPLPACPFTGGLPMPACRRLLAAAVTAAACLGAQALAAPAASATDTVVSRGVTVPAFYTPPATLPAANGALVRTEPLPLALSLPGLDGPLPGRATRLMYKSTDADGRPVAVTGAYI